MSNIKELSKQNACVVFLIVSLGLLFSHTIWLWFQDKVEVECTIISKGSRLSITGNEPRAQCQLESGKVIIIGHEHPNVLSYQLGQKVKTKVYKKISQ